MLRRSRYSWRLDSYLRRRRVPQDLHLHAVLHGKEEACDQRFGFLMDRRRDCANQGVEVTTEIVTQLVTQPPFSRHNY